MILRHFLIVCAGLVIGAAIEWRLGLEIIGLNLALQVGYSVCLRRVSAGFRRAQRRRVHGEDGG